jgi:putative PIG3 family NAD(P)H quinone oxidoreductase
MQRQLCRLLRADPTHHLGLPTQDRRLERLTHLGDHRDVTPAAVVVGVLPQDRYRGQRSDLLIRFAQGGLDRALAAERRAARNGPRPALMGAQPTLNEQVPVAGCSQQNTSSPIRTPVLTAAGACHETLHWRLAYGSVHAATLTSFGGPELFAWAEVPDPGAPGPGEVLIDVAATAVNRADCLQRQGFYPPPPGASEIIGMECSGVIGAVGDEVEDWHIGDEVCALLAGGGYAEKVLVAASQLLPIPAGVDLVQAAALPEVACTVWSNVFWLAQLLDGESFLVHGGTSGIGSFAIQAVRALCPASKVVTTARSAEKVAACLGFGAHTAINYRDEDFVERTREATGGRGADVILDLIGAKYLAQNLAALAPDGRLAIIGMQGGTKAELNIGALLTARQSIRATSLRGRPAGQKATIVAGTRDAFWPAIDGGAIKPVIDQMIPIQQVADAHRRMESSEHIGKIVLTVGQDG